MNNDDFFRDRQSAVSAGLSPRAKRFFFATVLLSVCVLGLVCCRLSFFYLRTSPYYFPNSAGNIVEKLRDLKAAAILYFDERGEVPPSDADPVALLLPYVYNPRTIEQEKERWFFSPSNDGYWVGYFLDRRAELRETLAKRTVSNRLYGSRDGTPPPSLDEKHLYRPEDKFIWTYAGYPVSKDTM